MSVKSEYTYPEKIVIGTRGSPLALWQANKVKSKIDNIGQNIDITICVIKTSGDWRPEDGEQPLEALEGGKAQFAKEIEEALLAGAIDIAVHSMKDMETVLPEGLVIPYMLPRADIRDAFLSNNSQNIHELPTASVVGTVSARRAAFLLHKRPDLKIVPFRGNVATRISKLRSGHLDATFLAAAGLQRLGLHHEIQSYVDIEDMLPSVGQGAIGIEVREDDLDMLSFINEFSCDQTVACVGYEREILKALGGSCHTPVGVLATYKDKVIGVQAKVVSLDGKNIWSESECIENLNHEQVQSKAKALGKRLKARVPDYILSKYGQ